MGKASIRYEGQENNKPSYATRFESRQDGALAVYDLSDVYSRDVEKYCREFNLTDSRTSLEVTDKISLREKSLVHYNLITRADVTVNAEEKCVILRQNGKECKLLFTSDAFNFKIEVGDLAPVGGFSDEIEEKFANGIMVKNSGETLGETKYAEPAKRIRLAAESEGELRISLKVIPQS